MTKKQHQSFWFSTALNSEKLYNDKYNCKDTSNILEQNIVADVCIIGGGYTGLWTAIQLKQKQKNLHIVIIEKDLCGSGASGRNGGCMLTWSGKYFTMEKLYGRQETVRLITESEQAIHKIKDFCIAHNIDADLRLDGVIYGASNKSQIGIMDDLIVALDSNNINSWTPLNRKQMQQKTGSKIYFEGYFSPNGGSVQPALLVRGLRRVAIEMGIDIYENTKMLSLDKQCPAIIKTPKGQVVAKKVVLAINAWTPEIFKQFNKSIVVVSSDMLITKPVPSLLKKAGLNSGISMLDLRTFVNYYHTTSDGRLVFGKGGNTFAYNNKISSQFDKKSKYKKQLLGGLKRFYQRLNGVEIETTWCGASDRSATGLPFFGHLNNHSHIVYGLGYSGNGVGQSYVGGQFLSAMVLGKKNAWTKSGMAQGYIKTFPPEPFRWIGAMVIKSAIKRNELAQDNNRQPRWWDLQLAKLADFASKANKS